MPFTITVCRDEEEGVWFVQSSDVPGLNAEAPSLDALVEAITDLVPDLVAANLPDSGVATGAPIPLHVQHIVNARSLSAA
jgi:predicted RNase H-like HicB family nuclease